MKKILTASEAVKIIKEGDSVMIGGFLRGGRPEGLIKAMAKIEAANITLICTDTGITDSPMHELFKSGKITGLYASYIGGTPEAGHYYMTGEAKVHLVPQGTLAERIRAGGAGLGGFLTPTGVGTIVEEGKQKMEINGKSYLLELPLRANVALIKAHIADEAGNLIIKGSSKNFNQPMATAADYVIVETDELVKIGEIGPDEVTVPGVYIDVIVIKEEQL
jgi:acetate CoA/acetoacetate CoA-transferase alpha subunit